MKVSISSELSVIMPVCLSVHAIEDKSQCYINYIIYANSVMEKYMTLCVHECMAMSVK